MAVQLGWWRKTVKTRTVAKLAFAGDRIDFALEITGDDATVTDGDEGRVKILEAPPAKKAAGAGEAEESKDRLICTFHGTWHRKGSSLSFAVFEAPPKPGQTVYDRGWRFEGYDPECIPGLGVDGFALTFVGVHFPVNFPFFLDSSTEGRFIELVAVAESGSGAAATELGRSAVLNVPIRRNAEVVSTTKGTSEYKRYTDDLVGNVVLHHESYLVQTARVESGKAWPKLEETQYLAIKPSTENAFADYPALAPERKLRIYLQKGLAEDLLPSDEHEVWSRKAIAALGGAKLRPDLVKVARKRIVDALKEILVEDAGFTGGRAAFLDAAPPGDEAVVATLEGTKPCTVPFFTFLVEQNDGLSSVGSGELLVHIKPFVSGIGFDWMLGTTFPLGAGDKQIKEAIQLRSKYFGEHFAKFVVRPRPKGAPALELRDVEVAVEKQAEKVAQTVAHEVGHSLGLMHESEVPEVGGPFVEDGVGPLRSIMNSKTDAEPYGAGVLFSNQAKIIWRDAFRVKPRPPTDSLVNKTWKDKGEQWRTMDWDERDQRMRDAIGEVALSRHSPDSNRVSPYKTEPEVQPGKYVP